MVCFGIMSILNRHILIATCSIFIIAINFVKKINLSFLSRYVDINIKNTLQCESTLCNIYHNFTLAILRMSSSRPMNNQGPGSRSYRIIKNDQRFLSDDM